MSKQLFEFLFGINFINLLLCVHQIDHFSFVCYIWIE